MLKQTQALFRHNNANLPEVVRSRVEVRLKWYFRKLVDFIEVTNRICHNDGMYSVRYYFSRLFSLAKTHVFVKLEGRDCLRYSSLVDFSIN